MSFERVSRKVFNDPWIIQPRVHYQIAETLKNRIAGKPQALEIEDFLGDVQETEIIDSVAVIPVKGIVSKQISRMEKACGACDVLDIQADIQAAVEDRSVKGIVLDIDSPGGTVWGVPELAEFIREARAQKRILSFTWGMACSAAYWIASATHGLYATESACVGSIGVYYPHLDVTAAYDAMGIKVELFKTGPHKGAGYPGVPLTDEQREAFQESVDFLFERFAGFVEENRAVPREAMDGRDFYAGQVPEFNLVDEIVENIGVAIADARRK